MKTVEPGEQTQLKEKKAEWMKRIRLTVLVLLFFIVLAIFSSVMYYYTGGKYDENFSFWGIDMTSSDDSQ